MPKLGKYRIKNQLSCLIFEILLQFLFRCGWLLFSFSYIQRVALANQQQTIFQAASDIDTPFQCIWTNIYGIGNYCCSTSPAIQIKCHPVHKQAIQTLFMELISPSAIDKQDPRYIFQQCMVFMTQDMLSITDAAYASLLLEQNDFQASEATLKVLSLCPLNTVITGSSDTLGIALTNLPDPTACNYLFCSIKPPLSQQNNDIFLCFNRQYTSYTSNLITSLYPTLALLYPDIQKTEVWITPSQHTSTSTISEILASSYSHLQTVMTFNPYNNRHVHLTPTPDSDLSPPTHHPHPKQHPKQHPKGKPTPSPRQQASTSPQPDQNSWTRPVYKSSSYLRFF